MSNRSVLYGGACVGFILAIFLVSFCNPEKQVRRHQRLLLSALEDRDWDDINELLAENYSDRWGHDKAFVQSRAAQVFRQFFAVQITGEITQLDMQPDRAELRTSLRVQGRGGPVAEYAMTRANALTDPWTFRWKKQSWKPWDWALEYVDQPQLEITEF